MELILFSLPKKRRHNKTPSNSINNNDKIPIISTLCQYGTPNNTDHRFIQIRSCSWRVTVECDCFHFTWCFCVVCLIFYLSFSYVCDSYFIWKHIWIHIQYTMPCVYDDVCVPSHEMINALVVYETFHINIIILMKQVKMAYSCDAMAYGSLITCSWSNEYYTKPCTWTTQTTNEYIDISDPLWLVREFFFFLFSLLLIQFEYRTNPRVLLLRSQSLVHCSNSYHCFRFEC